LRTILISGASRGIGRSIAERAVEDGCRVSLGLRNLDDLKGTKLDPSISGQDKILLSKYEAKDPENANKLVEQTVKHFGHFDTLIHCAGIFRKTELICPDSELDQIDEIFKVNLMGPWLLTRASWNHLSDHGEGRIVALISLSGKRSKGKLAGYTMSKFALMGLCQTMRNEGWEKGIRVTAICPGWVNTEMAAGVNSIPKGEMTQPEDIASITSNILKLPNSSVPFEISVNCTLEKEKF